MGELNPYAPPMNDGPHFDRVAAVGEGRFFLVSRTKFLVMCIATFGLYELYWFYKQWRYTKLRSGSDIWPIARAIFAIFFTHALLRNVQMAAAETSVTPRFNLQASAWGFIVLTLLQRLPDPFWLVALLAFVPLVPVQDTINEIEGKSAHNVDLNSRFSVANGLVLLVGLLFWAAVLIGLFVPDAVLD
jgi:hypothetical protein